MKKSDLLPDNIFSLFQIIHVCGEKICLKAIFQDSRACLLQFESLMGNLLDLKLQDNTNLRSPQHLKIRLGIQNQDPQVAHY